MDLKKRISSFINQILTQYAMTQKDLSKMLGVGLASLSAYLKAEELPRVDLLLKLAEIGGVTMDELLKGEKPPQKKEISVTISTHDKSSVMSVVGGDLYQNTTIRRVYKYTYQPGDLTEEQAAKLHVLVDEIINLEKTVRRSPRTHAAVWNALKRKFKVAYYRKIKEEDFEKARLYLMMWRGRLTKPLSKKSPDSYRKIMYGKIFAIAKNELGWTKEEVDSFIFSSYQVNSIKKLDPNQLGSLYSRIMGLKKKVR